jgi:hypothetical protein
MPIKYLALVLAGASVVSTGCNRSIRLLEPTPTDQTIITEVLTGTVAPPVNGVFQRTFRTYIVGQGGGPVTVTLTSAVLTRPDGTLLSTVTMGLGAGSMLNGACIVPATAFLATPAGTSPQLVGSLSEGTYCIEVSDVTGQTGPVAFSVKVTHT